MSHDAIKLYAESHGQRYVGCSRVGNPKNLFIIASNGKTNVVQYILRHCNNTLSHDDVYGYYDLTFVMDPDLDAIAFQLYLPSFQI